MFGNLPAARGAFPADTRTKLASTTCHNSESWVPQSNNYSAVSSYEPPRFESRGSEASAPFWSCSGLSSERAVPIAATPAARAAFLATCLAFGRRAFLVLPVLFPLVVFLLVAGLFALFAFLVFDLVLARFNEDLAFARLALFMLPPLWWGVAGLTLNSPQSNRVWAELLTWFQRRAISSLSISLVERRSRATVIAQAPPIACALERLKSAVIKSIGSLSAR
jgi:hypothetical protein